MSSYCLLAENPYIKVVSDTWLPQGGQLAEQTILRSLAGLVAAAGHQAPASVWAQSLSRAAAGEPSMTRPPEDSLPSESRSSGAASAADTVGQGREHQC